MRKVYHHIDDANHCVSESQTALVPFQVDTSQDFVSLDCDIMFCILRLLSKLPVVRKVRSKISRFQRSESNQTSQWHF